MDAEIRSSGTAMVKLTKKGVEPNDVALLGSEFYPRRVPKQRLVPEGDESDEQQEGSTSCLLNSVST